MLEALCKAAESAKILGRGLQLQGSGHEYNVADRADEGLRVVAL